MSDLGTDIQAGMLPPAPAGWEVATLPSLYERAREALRLCDSYDECAEWIRRAEAFASYYRQAADKTLIHLAQRIRLRAIRRCGELILDGPHGTLQRMLDRGEASSGTLRSWREIAKIPGKRFERELDASPPPSILRLLRVAVGAPEFTSKRGAPQKLFFG